MHVTEAQAFAKRLGSLLEESLCDEALTMFEQEVIRGTAVIQSVSSEIISIVAGYFTEFNVQYDLKRFECCKAILKAIAEKCNPRETVLEFLEQIECLDNDIKFCAILSPLSICMMKLEDKGIAIEWCISTIKSYIENLPLSNGDADQEDVINNRIIMVYMEIVSFLEPLVQEAVKINSKSEERSILADYLLSLLISLCGKPFCYLSKSTFEKASYKAVIEKIMTLAFCLTGDILCFLDIVSKRYRNTVCKVVCDKDIHTKNYDCIRLFESSNNISNLAYANFYFHIITEENRWKNVPQVYNFCYILEMCAYLFKALLCDEKEMSISIALTFMEHVIRQTPRCSVDSDMLGLEIYLDLFRRLIKVMIYCNRDKERKKAVKIFQEYVEIFDMKARYSIILYLYETSEHSGLLSLIINVLKSSIITCLNSTPRNFYFLGKNTESMLKKICNLPHGSSSDLIEISDEIITTLNLLRYLFIRDRDNETGIWNIANMLQSLYLKQLREGIDLCKAHWKVKLKDLWQQKAHDRCTEIQDYEMKKNYAEVTLTIAGEQLPFMPISQKIDVCHQAINSLDVMESILIRVNECIDLGFRCLWTSRTLQADQFENENNKKTESQQYAQEESDEEYEKNIKIKILGASLKFVPDMGWSKQAISAGAETIGYPGIVHGLFPNGGADLVHYFYSTCNCELNQMLEKEALEMVSSSAPRKPEEQIRDAVEKRLRMVIPYKKTWPQAMAIMTLPPNVPISLANLLTLIDDICYYAGDRSVDFNWYTRRMILAVIYKTTELYMLQDTSEDHKETWLFLERRIKDALQIYKVLFSSESDQSSDNALKLVGETGTAVFVTARNILGMHYFRNK